MLICVSVMAQSQIVLKKMQQSKPITSLTNINTSKFKLVINIPSISYEKKTFAAGDFIEMAVCDFSKSTEEGTPELPIYIKVIEVPMGAKVNINVISYNEELVCLSDFGINTLIKPAQPSEAKTSQSPTTFKYDKQAYSKRGYLNEEVALFEDMGVMRSCRLGQIVVSPIQYNPTENKLRILNNLVLEVEFVGFDNEKMRSVKRMYADPAFINTIANNGVGLTTTTYDDTKPRTYVIVSDIKFQNALQPFVSHKEMQGYNVIVAYTNNSNVGKNTTSIKSYLKKLYDSPQSGMAPPLYALLVGDTEFIPTFTKNGHPTDLYYFEYTGDYLPDVIYGRFSVSTVEQLENIIAKTIEYDSESVPVPAYMKKTVLIAGNDAYHELTYGNGMVNYGKNYFNSGNGITLYSYLQDEPVGANYSQAIIQKINAGVGFVNYSAHGSSNGWADPKISKSDIDKLSNYGKYGLWIGNCCLSNKFDESECFGESVIRAKNKGGIGYIGATDYTYWDEDYYWSVGYKNNITSNPSYNNVYLGAYDRMFHTNGENKEEWAVTQGQILIGGNMAVQSSSSNRKQYYWEVYHLLGDPSLRIIFNDNFCTTTILNGDITQNSIFYDCIINVKNAKISNNAIVKLNAEKDVTIEGEFEVKLGATIEIK